MSEVRKFFACMMFQNRLLMADGKSFEDLFALVMKARFPDFRKIKPHGNIGDQKNDGHIPSLGYFFVVYGPEEVEKQATVTYAKSKFVDDVTGLICHWSGSHQILKILVATNDKNRGLPAPLDKVISELDKNYPEIEISPFVFADLVKTFSELSIDQMQLIVGTIIPAEQEIGDISYQALDGVVQFLMKNWPAPKIQDSTKLKAFEEKIKINGITQGAGLLHNGSHCVGSIEDFLRRNVSYQTAALRDTFVRLYEEAKLAIPDTVPNCADTRLFYILEAAQPNNQNAAVANALTALVAYFFELCDIFEVGKAAST